MELESDLTLLRAVIGQIRDGVAIFEPETFRIVVANGEAMRILGTRDVPGASLSDLGAWEALHAGVSTRPDEHLPVGRALRGEALTARGQLVRPDGSRVALELRTGPIHDAAGRVVGAVAVLADLTEREQLHHAEREFVTNAAHELRTPLAAISSAVEVLRAGAKDVPEERDHFLEHIDRECARLARLTTALLSLARAQGGVEKPRVDLVELCPLLEQLASSARPADGVAVEAYCPVDLLAVANPDLLEQALANLVSNAARHTREGSIALGARPDGEQRVAVEIRDTGSGMTDEERVRVTERFYRGTDGDGFGLGLAIAADAVRAVGGELELESEVGRGTVARVTLPAGRLVST